VIIGIQFHICRCSSLSYVFNILKFDVLGVVTLRNEQSQSNSEIGK